MTARVLGYPTLNLVVDQSGVAVTGPTRRESQRVLSGHGWAVGVLLQPAATRPRGYAAVRLVDCALPLEEPSLRADVVAAMSTEQPPEERHLAAVGVVSVWLRERVGTAAPSERDCWRLVPSRSSRVTRPASPAWRR